MPTERDSTSALRSVADDADTWLASDRTGTAATSDDAMEAFFGADPATAARAMLDNGAVTTEVHRGRYEARKVRRLVRHIEPWSVLKVSLIFYFCLWVILLVAGTILWRVADSSGMIDNIESFTAEMFSLSSFEFDARTMFRIYAVGGLVAVIAATGFTVTMAVLFNLISDLTGGMRVTVIEEETARPRRR